MLTKKFIIEEDILIQIGSRIEKINGSKMKSEEEIKNLLEKRNERYKKLKDRYNLYKNEDGYDSVRCENLFFDIEYIEGQINILKEVLYDIKMF